MDAILPQLLAFPPHPPSLIPLPDAEYDKQIKSLVQLLNQIPANKLTGGVTAGGDLLDILNPSINTLPYLFALLAHVNGSSGKQATGTHSKKIPLDGQLWRKMVEFLDTFDPVQVRYGGPEFRRLIEVVARTANADSNPFFAVGPIRSALLRLDSSSSCFTSLHLLFVRLCLGAKDFIGALPILDKDISHIIMGSDRGYGYANTRYLCAHHDSGSTFITNASGLSDKLEYLDHLQYFLYGAMIYMALKKWKRALFFLEIVIMSPANNTASMIQVEAYKKWVLVGLLLKGKTSPLPKTITSQTVKIYAALAKSYDNLAKTFEDGISGETNANRLVAESNAGEAVWREDCNSGIVKQVIDAFRRTSISTLEKTYVSLPISDVAHRTSPEPKNYAETAAYVESLISAGHLNATLTKSSEGPQTWALHFAESATTGPRARSEVHQLEDLVGYINSTAKLIDRVQEANRRMGLSREYIDWSKKMQKMKKSMGAGEPSPFISTGEDCIAEEDMMADL